jgi:hypothetical protein
MIRTCRSQDAVGGVGKEGISPRRTQRTRRRKEDEERMDARTNRVRGCSVSVPGLPRPVRSWIRRLRTLDIVSLFRTGRGRPGSLTSTCIALRTRCFLGVLCVLRGAMPSCSAEPRSFSRPPNNSAGRPFSRTARVVRGTRLRAKVSVQIRSERTQIARRASCVVLEVPRSGVIAPTLAGSSADASPQSELRSPSDRARAIARRNAPRTPLGYHAPSATCNKKPADCRPVLFVF